MLAMTSLGETIVDLSQDGGAIDRAMSNLIGVPMVGQDYGPISVGLYKLGDRMAWVFSKKTLFERKSTWMVAGGGLALAVGSFFLGRATKKGG